MSAQTLQGWSFDTFQWLARNMIRQENQNSTGWTPLPPGTLIAFAKKARFRRRWKQFARAATPVTVLILLVLVAPRWSDSAQPSQPRFGGVTCDQVVSHFESLSTGDLDQSLMASIQAHLKQCPACRQKMESMQRTQSVATQSENLADGSLSHSQLLVAFVK